MYKQGKKLIKFVTEHTRVHSLYGTYFRLQLLKIAKIRFGSYFLTFRHLLRVRYALGAMVMNYECDDLSINIDGMDSTKEIVLDSYFGSQVKNVL